MSLIATMNLLPNEEQRKRKVDLLNYYTLLGGIVLVCGSLVLAATLLLFDQVYKVNLENLNTTKQQAQAQTALYLDVQKKAETLSKQLATLQSAQSQTTHWSSLLSELQGITPANVSITSIKLGQAAGLGAAKTIVSGHAASRRAVGQFQLALANSAYFKDPEIQVTTQSGNGVDYTISTDIAYDRINGPRK